MLNLRVIYITFLASVLTGFKAGSQIVTLSPPFATIEDTITVLFNAREGSKGLTGESQVYMHAGLITNLSGPNGWRYVQGMWGQDDPKVKMSNLGNDLHTISFYIPDFFGVPPSEEVKELAFVFRNRDGSKTGKTSSGGDIFVPLYPVTEGLAVKKNSPSSILVIPATDSFLINIQTNQPANYYVIENSDTLERAFQIQEYENYFTSQPGDHWLKLIVQTNDSTWQDSVYYTQPVRKEAQAIPAGMEPGIHILEGNQVQVLLEAPQKKFIHLLGSSSHWLPSTNWQLTPDTSENYWWGSWSLLAPDTLHLYQYLVDGNLRIADPYSTLILDPAYDGSIGNNFPAIPPYPTGQTSGLITWIRDAVPFTWTDGSYQRPDRYRLNIYELLIRDFLADHSYNSLIDSLDYLKKLGINAIELMPVSEFEGNESWGYNPDFHMALDKYYGPPEAFKALVDGAHQRGMAVLLDVVFNHVTGQSPLAQLYWDPALNRPAANNPWLNETARHPFNVFNDFNHESTSTQKYMDRVLRYWVDTYHIDGFRFDLSKGFTQKLTTNNTAMSAYDPSRVAILNRMAGQLHQVDPDLILILEHFADLEEETLLSDQGFLLWNNVGGAFTQAAEGFNGDLSGAAYTTKGWTSPATVSYMESHDEERVMFKVLGQGNQNNEYSLRNLPNGLRHAGLSAVFLMAIPGPKMIWQFGEIGYDYSINTCPDGSVNNDCRLANKPIRWDYLNQADRQKLLSVYREMFQLRDHIGAFHSPQFELDVTQLSKQITLHGADSTVIVLGNFAIINRNTEVKFTHSGWWYDFVTGDSLEVTEWTTSQDLSPGEYRIWADFKWNSKSQTTSRDALQIAQLSMYPVPACNHLTIEGLPNISPQTIHLWSVHGQEIQCHAHRTGTGWQLEWERYLPAGVYYLTISDQGRFWRQKLIIQP